MKPYKIVNSETSLKLFIDYVVALFKEHKYLTFEWRIGAERSLPQNALMHVWLTEYAAHLLKISVKDVSPPILDGIKHTAKKRFYGETGARWMIEEMIDPWHPDKTKKAFTSSSQWKTGEMFMFLTWLQHIAAEDGLILEATGQYLKLKGHAEN